MGGFLNKITVGQIALTALLAGLADWLIENDVVFWITFITIVIACLLAVRKGLIILIKDVKQLITFFKSKF